MCNKCYNNARVRNKYQPKKDYRKDLKHLLSTTEILTRKLPPTPTNAMPGSIEKVLVMAERFANGYHLYHPKDAKIDIK